MESKLRNIPQGDELLKDNRIVSYQFEIPHRKRTAILRDIIDRTKKELVQGKLEQDSRSFLQEYILTEALKVMADYIKEKPVRLINATGIIIHTNLGRAPLSQAAVNRVGEVAANYSNLEYSTVEGKRSNRLRYIEKKLTGLTGAEAALVVNNNAAAVLLALNSLAKNKEVILSRGEIVEIGDSFRISEIMEAGGCIIREAGTTNKTYLRDYEKAITTETALLLKVHTSNFKIVGFTEETFSKNLVVLGQTHGIPTMEDMGSGILVDLSKYGLTQARRVQDAVKDGVDIITFSGDKMLGGPQAGIILGKKKYLEPMRQNPLLRCLRIDKMCLAALDATLSHYLEEEGVGRLPVLGAAIQPLTEIYEKACLLCKMLDECSLPIHLTVDKHEARFGGGAMPFEHIDSYAVYMSSSFYTPNQIQCYLREQVVPIVATLQSDQVILDVRTICVEDFDYIRQVIRGLYSCKT